MLFSRIPRVLKSDDDDSDELGTFSEVMGWIGTCISIIFYFLPGQIVLELIRKKITTKEVNIAVFLLNVLNGLLWTAYGARKDKMQVIIANGTGFAFTGVYSLILCVYFAEKKPLKSFFLMILYLDIIAELFYIFYKMIGPDEVVQYIVLVVNILMFFAPGIKLVTVIKTKNRALIPVYLSFANTVGCIAWTIYGLSLGDVSVWVPNGLGIIISVVQIAVWAWCRCKYPNGDPNAKNLELQNVETEKAEMNERKGSADYLEGNNQRKDTAIPLEGNLITVQSKKD